MSIDSLMPATADVKRTAGVQVLTVSASPEAPRIRSVGMIKGDPRTVDLTDADIIVDAGRGLGSPQGFRLVEELADVIGGSVGATRMVVDARWTGSDRQIGLTGKTVKPKLIIACGISGASQHVMAMKDSNTIVAINLDRNAPIFKIADVSVVGDVLQVVPALTERLRKALGKKPAAAEVLDVLSGPGGMASR